MDEKCFPAAAGREGRSSPSEARAPAPATAPHPDQRLARHQRVTRSAHFQEAYDQARIAHGRCMVMRLRSGPEAALRLGVVTGRRIGNAVQRVRTRRRLREAFRRHRHLFHGAFDVILSAKPRDRADGGT